MTAARRWWIVALGVLLLLATPVLVRALPVAQDDTPATTLLQRAQAAFDKPFSGYAETTGNVDLPKSNALSSLTGLLTETNHVRVWWRGPGTWRTATLRPTGETDLVHSADQTIRWVYESRTTTVVPDVPIRLPVTSDLLPNELAHRVLRDARPSELHRLPARRVAGRVALGLRLTPADPQTSLARVDVYVDRATGVPLRAEVYGKGSRIPAVVSRFLDFTPGRPAGRLFTFSRPEDALFHVDNVVDIASAADRYAQRVPPDFLAGLPRRPGAHVAGLGGWRGSVGLYGRGPTVLIAVPVWSRTAPRIRADLRNQPHVTSLDEGLLLTAAPLRLLLSQPEPNGTSWLLAGTVTQDAIVEGANQLARHRPGIQGLP